jgi:hypothetical protein
MSASEIIDPISDDANIVADFNKPGVSADEIIEKLDILHENLRNSLNTLHSQIVATETLIGYVKTIRDVIAHRDDPLKVAETMKAASTTVNISAVASGQISTQRTLSNQGERVKATIEAATDLVNSGSVEFSIDDVLHRLIHKGINLGVARPASVVGTILSGNHGFTKIAPGRYRNDWILESGEESDSG